MTKVQQKANEMQAKFDLVDEMRLLGKNNKQIAEELHRRYPDKTAVQHYRWIFGNIRVDQKVTMAERVKKVMALRESGMKSHDVAVECGITTDQVRYIFDREYRKKYWLEKKASIGSATNNGYVEVSGKIQQGDIIFWSKDRSQPANKDQIGETIEFIRKVRPKARLFRFKKKDLV